MKRFILSIILECLAIVAFPQFYGGNGDGFSFFASGVTLINDPVIFCSGGNNDGYSRITAEGHLFHSIACYWGGNADGNAQLATGWITMTDQDFYLSGADGDGFCALKEGPATLNDQDMYAGGGSYDGFSEIGSGSAYIANQAIYAAGGTGDGFYCSSYIGPIIMSPAWLCGNSDGFAQYGSMPGTFGTFYYCLGGTDDGAFSLHHSPTYFGPGIWLGVVSSSWENPANWSADIVPGENINVLIPSGRSYYPFIWSGGLSVNGIGGYFQCKSLTIRDGGSLTNRSDLFIYGDMTVEGLYQGDDQFQNHVIVYPGGNLKIVPPGQMIVGEE
jgi:hypothetical protein